MSNNIESTTEKDFTITLDLSEIFEQHEKSPEELKKENEHYDKHLRKPTIELYEKNLKRLDKLLLDVISRIPLDGDGDYITGLEDLWQDFLILKLFVDADLNELLYAVSTQRKDLVRDIAYLKDGNRILDYRIKA